MKHELLQALDNPKHLEQLYHTNTTAFKTAFFEIYPSIKDTPTAQVWFERLSYSTSRFSWGTSTQWTTLILSIFLAGLFAKVPDWFGWAQDAFYAKNASFIVFPFIMLSLRLHQSMGKLWLWSIAGISLMAFLFMNGLPDGTDTTTLSILHLPLFMWTMVGFLFVNGEVRQKDRIMEFLRLSGDVFILAVLLTLAGGVFTALTIGLFSLIGMNLEWVLQHYLLVWGLPAIPLLATHLVLCNPGFIKQISPAIARIFTPMAVVALTVYLVALVLSNLPLYTNREFLLLFNALLVAVMALLFFSISGMERINGGMGRVTLALLASLAILSLIIDMIALSAIIYRIAEWGFTPNRLAVLGSNLLLLLHVANIAWHLSKVVVTTSDFEALETSLVRNMPVYSAWFLVVWLVFPLLFQFA